MRWDIVCPIKSVSFGESFRPQMKHCTVLEGRRYAALSLRGSDENIEGIDVIFRPTPEPESPQISV